MDNSTRRQLVLIVLVLALTFIGFGVYANRYNLSLLFTDVAYISVVSAPDNIQLEYDKYSISVPQGEKIPIRAGEYTLKFTSTEFEPYLYKVNLEKDQLENLIFAMTPTTEDAKKELELTKYSLVYDGIAGREVSLGAKQIEQDNPGINSLPIETLTYSIDTCNPSTTPQGVIKVQICITTTGRFPEKDRLDALTALRKTEIDLIRYVILVNGKRIQI